MANGSAALKLLAPEPPPDEHSEPSAPAELGLAVAGATAVLCRAMFDYRQNGELDPQVREAGGSGIAKVATWQLDHGLGDLEFAAVARQQGKIQLRQHLNTDFFRHNSPAEVEAALDFYIDSLLEMVSRVVKDERAFRAAWAN
jgi:hypothetical protein